MPRNDAGAHLGLPLSNSGQVCSSSNGLRLLLTILALAEVYNQNTATLGGHVVLGIRVSWSGSTGTYVAFSTNAYHR
jgi:hypothetical protein